MSFIYRVLAHFGLSTPRQLRISFMRIFMQPYLVRQKLIRKGSCTHGDCAKEVCCKSCDWLVEKNRKYYCKDYKNAPQNCQDFPLFEKELDNLNVKYWCGYYWD